MSDDSEIDVKVVGTDELSPMVSKLNAGILSHVANLKAAAVQYNVVGTAGSASMGQLRIATSGVAVELTRLGHEALSGNFSRMPGSLLVMASRMGGLNLAAIGVAGAFVAIGGVMYEFISRSNEAAENIDKLSVALKAMGKSGTSGSALEEEIDKLSLLPGVSRAAAEEVVGAYTRMNNIGGEQIAKLADVTRDFAAVIGEKPEQAGKILAEAFSNIGRGAEELQKKMSGGLDASLVNLAIEEANAGKETQAFNTLLKALQNQVDGANAKLDESPGLWNRITTAVEGTIQTFRELMSITDAITTKPLTDEEKKQAALRAENNAKIADGNQKLETALGLSRQIGGEVKKQVDLQNELDKLNAGLGKGNSADDQKILAPARNVQQQIADLRNEDVQKQEVGQEQIRDGYEKTYSIYKQYQELAVESGQETTQQEYQNLIAAKEQEKTQVMANFELSLSLFNKQSAAYAAMLKKEKDAEVQFSLDIATLRQQATKVQATEDKKFQDDFVRSLNGVNSAFASSMIGLITHTRTWQQSFQQIARSAFTKFIEMSLQKTEKYIADQLLEVKADQAGEAAKLATQKSGAAEGNAVQAESVSAEILKNAGGAASGAYNALAGIPIVGPFLGAAAAAAAFAAVMAYDSFDVGTDKVMSSGLANIHAGEMIVPAAQAAQMRGEGSGPFSGSAIGGGGDTHVHFNVSAMDGKSFGEFLNRNGSQLARAFKQHMRNPSARSQMARS